ncbi:hypothetical protein BG015_004190, partial [Linnemannia schmuckeri]
MDNNPLILFCLIDGEATANTVLIEIESTKTIGDLKDFIKTKQNPAFDDIVTESLALWSVSISGDDNDEEILVLLNTRATIHVI